MMQELDKAAVAMNERKPGAIRAAPAPLYSSSVDAWRLVQARTDALRVAQSAEEKGGRGSDEQL